MQEGSEELYLPFGIFPIGSYRIALKKKTYALKQLRNIFICSRP